MDELTIVRELLAPPPPPGPEATAQARQRLVQSFSGQRVPARPAARWRSRRARRAAVLTGAVAASLAGALAATVLMRGTTQPGQAGGGLVTSERPFGALAGHPAQPFLVALATRVARATPVSGRYWCQAMISGQLDPIGPGGQELTPAGQGEKPSPASDYRYSIFARQKQDDCFDYRGATPRNVGGYLQTLGARPATARDVAAWRQDGSPIWHGWYGNRQLIPARPGRAVRAGGKPGQEPWGNGASLPADPAKLRKVLLALAGIPGPSDPRLRNTERQTGQSYAQIQNENLFVQARILLLGPLSPAVRAAAYQVLASLPGVRMKADVADPSGRIGTALWFGPPVNPGQIVIVDPATGTLLADEWLATAPQGVYAPGTLTQYALWQTPGWTSKLPMPRR